MWLQLGKYKLESRPGPTWRGGERGTESNNIISRPCSMFQDTEQEEHTAIVDKRSLIFPVLKILVIYTTKLSSLITLLKRGSLMKD